jgi:hypothetical protein
VWCLPWVRESPQPPWLRFLNREASKSPSSSSIPTSTWTRAPCRPSSTARFSSPKTARKPTWTSATTSVSSPRGCEGQQLHHRPNLQKRAGKRAPWRLPGQNRSGHSAHHQRNPGFHQTRRGCGHPDAVDVAIVEIGGTVGDIESLPFLEAVRQMSLKLGPNNTGFCAPDLCALDRGSGRAQNQTHPAHGAKVARNRHPGRRACCAARTAHSAEEREKISLFSNVPEWGVISMWDVDTIYKVPRMLHEQGLDGLICDKLRIHTPPANLKRWDALVLRGRAPPARSQHCHGAASMWICQTATSRSTKPCATRASTTMPGHIEYIDSETLRRTTSPTGRFDAILVPGGFGKRGIEGKICAARFAREQNSLPGHLLRHASGHH